MKKKTAIKHFGSGAEIARRLNITRAAVSAWPDVVPLKYVWELRQQSGGKLAVRLNDYRPKVVE